MSKYFVDAAGIYIGAFDGVEPPIGSIEVIAAPIDACQLWQGDRWGDIPVTVEAYKSAIQLHMDAAAQSAGYDDIKTAVTYAEEPSVAKFQAEGQAFRAWRSKCWAYCYEQLALIQGGKRSQPTIPELLAELPPLELPHE